MEYVHNEILKVLALDTANKRPSKWVTGARTKPYTWPGFSHGTPTTTTVVASAEQQEPALGRVRDFSRGVLNDRPEKPWGVRRELNRLSMTTDVFNAIRKRDRRLVGRHDRNSPVGLDADLVASAGRKDGDRIELAIEAFEQKYYGSLWLIVPGTPAGGRLVAEIYTDRGECATCIYRALQWALGHPTPLLEPDINQIRLPEPTGSWDGEIRVITPRSSEGIAKLMSAVVRTPGMVQYAMGMLFTERSPMTVVRPAGDSDPGT